MTRRVPQTLLEVCTARAVAHRGGNPDRMLDVLRAAPQGLRVAELVIEWAIATVQGIDPPEGGRWSGRQIATTAEYAAFWRVNERHGWRQRAQIRELFSDDEFQDVVAELAGFLAERGLTGPAAVRAGQAAPVRLRSTTTTAL